MSYNLSTLDNATNILEVAQSVSIMSGLGAYILGDMTVFMFFIIYMALSYRESFRETLLIGSFLSTIIGIMFYSAGFSSLASVLIPSFTMVFSLVYVLMSRG